MKGKLQLKELSLQNFATFENQTIHFCNLFNAIVGETGSGKSLILDAFQLILGHRADKKLIRKNTNFAVVEATFKTTNDSLEHFFEDKGFPFQEDEILIKRIIYPSKPSKTYVNHQSCSINFLSDFSKRFIDLVGQFENQRLLSSDYQLKLLDTYGELQRRFNDYKKDFEKYSDTKNKLNILKRKRSESLQRKDYLEFQIKELQQLNPSSVEEENLILKKEQLLNKEKQTEYINQLQKILSEQEFNLLKLINQSKKILSNISSEQSSSWDCSLNEAASLIEDISYELASFTNEEFNREEINTIFSKLDQYQQLKRKFSCDTEELSHKLSSTKAELEELSNIDWEISSLEKSLISLEEICYQKASELHTLRQNSAQKLSKSLTESVQKLAMKHATISISVLKLETLSKDGLSKVVFNAETNRGEGFHQIKDIASGGELSRILLALRQLVSQNDSISIFFFDEIDTGIGGETAKTIGLTLKNVSLHGQVIAITHLPQIAKEAERLIVVNKNTIQNNEALRTYSTVKEINHHGRNEILRDMAGLDPLKI